MLRYAEACLSPYEVPDEISLCLYISGCQNNCHNCHYPALKSTEYGAPLADNISSIIDAYLSQITCVCFLGEGRNTSIEHEEFAKYVDYAHSRGLKACLYCGRDIFPEDWMLNFDYVKVGSYRQDFGDLFHRTTNQRLYLNRGGKYSDITSNFWEHKK